LQPLNDAQCQSCLLSSRPDTVACGTWRNILYLVLIPGWKDVSTWTKVLFCHGVETLGLLLQVSVGSLSHSVNFSQKASTCFYQRHSSDLLTQMLGCILSRSPTTCFSLIFYYRIYPQIPVFLFKAPPRYLWGKHFASTFKVSMLKQFSEHDHFQDMTNPVQSSYHYLHVSLKLNGNILLQELKVKLQAKNC